MIAAWIRTARKDADLSQEALGAKLALALGEERGFTKANISHWETRKHSPNLKQLLAISRITGKSLPPDVLHAVGGEQRHFQDLIDNRETPRPSSKRVEGETPPTMQGLASLLDLKAETAKELRLLTIYRLANEREREAIDDIVDQMSSLIEMRGPHETKRAS